MIGYQFEYGIRDYDFGGNDVIRHFVTVLDVFVHHYTGEKMRYIRIEKKGTLSGIGYVEYKTVDEKTYAWMLKSKIEEEAKEPDYTLSYEFHGENDTTYFNGSAKELEAHLKKLESNGFNVYCIKAKDGREYHRIKEQEVVGC